MSATTRQPSTSTSGRVATAGALALAVLAVAYLLLTAGPSYLIHAHFLNAGGLVRGDEVELAGRSVGSVTELGVTPDGQADVTLSVSDGAITPLHAGTRATIRALGQAGVANHYVELSPGPAGAPALAGGSALPTAQTTSLVNYDAILDSFGPAQRANLKTLIADGAQIYAGSGARSFNLLLARLSPALRHLDGLTSQLAADRGAIGEVIHTGSIDAGAIASRSPDLLAAVSNTASSLGAIASQRAALADALTRAPAVLAEATRTLRDTGSAVTTLRPALREIPAAATPLRGLLARLDAILPVATPVVAQLRSELPDLRAGLSGLRPLAPVAVPALHSAATALRVARPIVQAARYYGSDLLLGVFQGLAGVATANYDRWGHYARLEFTQPYQTSLGGPLSNLLATPIAPSVFNLRTRLLRRCPGGNAPPAPDGSNPWVPNTSICTPAEDVPLSVDFP
jgi:phospholipid/cholesterol/gamma-HCH transport system substrate-binding protein